MRPPLARIRLILHRGRKEQVLTLSLADLDMDLVTRSADAGSQPVARERTDLAVLAGEVVECLQVLAEEKEQAIVIQAHEPVFAQVDAATMRQALITCWTTPSSIRLNKGRSR